MTYQEKLKDPRWQKKRLKALEKHGWKCDVCGDTEKTLHVHHLRYDGEPWDVSDESLQVLCESCHEKTHKPPIDDVDDIFKGWEMSIILKSIDSLEKKTACSFWLFVHRLCYLYEHCGKEVDNFLKDVYFDKTPDGQEAKRQLEALKEPLPDE